MGSLDQPSREDRAMPACRHRGSIVVMAQVTWRTSGPLIERVQNLAAAQGVSMNEFLTRVLTIATDSDEADPLAVRLRDRLRAAGVLAEGTAMAGRPGERELAQAKAAAGTGVALSDVVSSLRE